MGFRAGAHLWFNPKLRGTPAEIPIILARPTLFDVVKLARQYPLEALHGANRRLRAGREISERQFLRTQEILRRIEQVRNDGIPAMEEAATVAIKYEEPPALGAQIPTPEQRRRALADWLRGGLPTFRFDLERCIRLDDVPLEFEIPLRRWLRWQLDSEPEKASLWLIYTSGQVLTHRGWRAILSWLTDALLCRLDQIEVGM